MKLIINHFLSFLNSSELFPVIFCIIFPSNHLTKVETIAVPNTINKAIMYFTDYPPFLFF